MRRWTSTQYFLVSGPGIIVIIIIIIIILIIIIIVAVVVVIIIITFLFLWTSAEISPQTYEKMLIFRYFGPLWSFSGVL